MQKKRVTESQLCREKKAMEKVWEELLATP
jgi:hypothetical protein